MEAPTLSLPAELLLLSIDPDRGGLVVKRRRRRRLDKAIEAAGGTRATALLELGEAGLVSNGNGFLKRPTLVDSSRATARFGEIQERIRKDSFAEAERRDVDLFVLLAWSGVLARRLDKGERELARWRLKRMGKTLTDSRTQRAGSVGYDGDADVSAVFLALGINEMDNWDSSLVLEGSGLSESGGGGGDGGGGWFGGGGDGGGGWFGGDSGGGGGGDFGGGDGGGGGSF